MKNNYSKEEVIELIELHSAHIYQGYYVFKIDLEDVLTYDKAWIDRIINKKNEES